MLKSLILGVVVAIGSFGDSMVDIETVASVDVVSVNEAVENDTVQLDVFYMYSDENGSYWLEPEAEYENVVWIGFKDLKEWNINIDELSHGNRLVGTFDETGWELFGLEYVE